MTSDIANAAIKVASTELRHHRSSPHPDAAAADASGGSDRGGTRTGWWQPPSARKVLQGAGPSSP